MRSGAPEAVKGEKAENIKRWRAEGDAEREGGVGGAEEELGMGGGAES